MFDGFKILSLPGPQETYINNPQIEPFVSANTKTGEISNKPPEAKKEGLIFTFYPGRTELRGSLHTYSNGGLHNYNDFNFRRLENTILGMKHDLGIDPEKSILNNLEIGVNLELPHTPDRFLNQIIMHRGEPFTWQHEKTKRYRECSHTQFFIKSYNKGIQNKLNRNILRFELKYIKMEKINRAGIKTLSDLIRPGHLERIGELIVQTFDEVLIGNLKADYSKLNNKDRELFIQGHNPSFWKGIKPTEPKHPNYKRDRKTYERRLKRFNELLERTGANELKKEIRRLIIQKIKYLCDPGTQGEIDREPLKEKRGKLTDINQVKLTNLVKPHQGEIDPLLYSVNLRHTENPEKRKCLVTGIDISNQKTGSKFLSPKTIREMYFKDPSNFNKLLVHYGSKRPYLSKENQCYFVAHNIRNMYYRIKGTTPGG